jgi:IS30 family transposase
MRALKKENDGYSYIVTCIDVFSRKGYAVPMKTKSKIDVINAFKFIFKSNKPDYITSDKGSEFMSKSVTSFF